jgi:hypothetical protein
VIANNDGYEGLPATMPTVSACFDNQLFGLSGKRLHASLFDNRPLTGLPGHDYYFVNQPAGELGLPNTLMDGGGSCSGADSNCAHRSAHCIQPYPCLLRHLALR